MKKILVPKIVRDGIHSLRKDRFLKGLENWKTIVDFRGCKLFAGPDNKIEAALMKGKNTYDFNNFNAVSHFVKSGFVCFDIGANIGVYSNVFSFLSGDSNLVHAFEPVRHIRNRLKMNAKLNGYYGLHINDFALGAEESKVEMFQVKEGLFRGGTSTFVYNENIDNMGEECFERSTVDIQTLDQYVSDHGLQCIDFIKIDVESYELHVLQGGKRSIGRFKPTILIEYDHERHNKDTLALKAFFEDEDYHVFEFRSFGEELVLQPFSFDHQPYNRNLVCFCPESVVRKG